MELQFFLKNNPNWREILSKEPYCLKWQEDGDYIIFTYNQLSSDFFIPLVREARGIIFEKNTYEVVCRPFTKFGNYGESYAAKVNWDRCWVTEKIDGSLIKVWYHNGWHVSTNGTIDAANANLDDVHYSNFMELFIAALRRHGFTYTSFLTQLNKEYTYLFELVSPYNRVVIPYDSIDLYYLTRIHTGTGIEEWGGIYGELLTLPTPDIYSMVGFDNIISAAENLPWDKEGYVVFDELYNRVKVKSPAYVLAHYARNNNVITWKRLISVVLVNQQEEFLTYCNDYRKQIQWIEDAMFSANVQATYSANHIRVNYKGISRKEYAEIAGECPNWMFGFLMRNFDREISWEEYTSKWNERDWDRFFCQMEGANYGGYKNR